MPNNGDKYVLAGRLSEMQGKGCHVAQVDGRTLALFHHQDKVFAVDNRCPHMGFPLDRGTVRDGILTCHWHHARFDLATGGAFDLFADDVPSFPVEIRGDDIWVDLSPRGDPRAHQLQRLKEGLEQELPLVIAKTVIALNDVRQKDQSSPQDLIGLNEAFAAGLDFGTRFRQAGWGQGLTMLTCFANLLPRLDADDRPLALYQGLSAVAVDTSGSAPRFPLVPLPGTPPDFDTLKRWFRRFVEVRDSQGAERCVVTALRAGADPRQMADMLFSSVTDHRYIDTGHRADFTNKALEALDRVGWEQGRAEMALTSLASGYANASRSEESNAWRNPVDLIVLLHAAFEALPAALEAGQARRGIWQGREALAPVLLSDEPEAIPEALLEALRQGATETELAAAVAYAAALRIARFHTSNEFGDWDTALHTFSFANAIHQGLRRLAGPDGGRIPSVEPLRGVFDAAMSVYLDRFLNIPAARLPRPEANGHAPEAALSDLPTLLDRQQMVNEAGAFTARYVGAGGQPARWLAAVGKMLLREDRDFHTIQTVEAAFAQYDLLGDTPEGLNVLVAAARYLAAHSPTVRAEGQTYGIARRLHRGEKLFEEEEA